MRVLEEDPDLGRTLGAREYRDALPDAVASIVELPAGSNGLANRLHRQVAGMGWLVLSGVLLRQTTVDTSSFAEVIGPGDLMTGYDVVADEELVHHSVRCDVVDETRLAVLDRAFTQTAGRWPELVSAVVDRGGRRSARLSLGGAISNMSRVDSRLLVSLWLLAERWGRVTGEGVLLDLALPHRTLGQMIGARRPTVTKALRTLEGRGLVHRNAKGGLVLAAPIGARAEGRGVVRPPGPGPGDLEMILTNVDVGVALLDGDERVRLWNVAAEKLWGLPRESALGTTFSSLELGPSLEELSGAIGACLDGGSEQAVLSLELQDGDGGPPRRCRVTCIPRDGHGVILLMDAGPS